MVVFHDAKDKNVGSRVFFGNTTDDKLYVDAEFTVQAKEEEVTDAFLKCAMIVQVGTSFNVATKVAANIVTVGTDTFAAVPKA